MVAIFIFSTGCTKYDYTKEQIVGYVNYDELVQEDLVTNYYDGTYTSIISEKTKETVSIYADSNVSVVSLEKRYDMGVLTIFINSDSILDNFEITFAYYDKQENLIAEYSSTPQTVVGGFYASVLIKIPEEFEFIQVVSYQGDNIGVIDNISFYDFSPETIEQKSNTTYYCNKDLKNILFLTEDGRIVYGQKEINKGEFTVGRNYISYYAIWEVK